MPTTEELSEGSRRAFVYELHLHFRTAMRPTLAQISTATAHLEPPQAVSRETIRRLLKGETISTWKIVDAVLRALCQIGGSDPDAERSPGLFAGDTYRSHLQELWNNDIDGTESAPVLPATGSLPAGLLPPGPGQETRPVLPATGSLPAGLLPPEPAQVTVPVVQGARQRPLGNSERPPYLADRNGAVGQEEAYGEDPPVGHPTGTPLEEVFFTAYSQFLASHGSRPTARDLARALSDGFGVTNADGNLISEPYLRRYLPELRMRYTSQMGIS